MIEKFLDALTPGPANAVPLRQIRMQAENRTILAAFASRGKAKGPLTFEVDGIMIVLDVQPANAGMFNILGQVAADDQDQWTEAFVELRRNHELQCSATLDDLGAFRCEGIMAGEHELRIRSRHSLQVVVSNFTVTI